MKRLLLLPFLLTACTADVFNAPTDSGNPDSFPNPDSSTDSPSGLDGSDGGIGNDASEASDAATDAKDVSTCAPEVIVGSVPTANMTGHSGEPAGVVLKALTSSALTGFTVVNQGSSGTVSLLDTSSTVLHTLTYPASSPTYVATVAWPLVAGTTYYLVIDDANNGKDITFFGYPMSDSSLSATGAYLSGPLGSNLWIVFTDITSCP